MVRAVARYHGYAVGVHGTLARDIDLIAVPWTDEAVAAELLADAIAGAVVGLILQPADDEVRGSPTLKPHRRLAWSIYGVLGTYIDLSIMPRGGS